MAFKLNNIRESLKAAAEGVTSGGGTPTYTLLAARVKLGMDYLSPNAQFLTDLETDGPFLLIHPGALETMDSNTDLSTYRIMSELWFGIARESDNDFLDIEKLVEAIKAAWSSHAVSWDAPAIDTKRNPATVRYLLSVVALGC